MAASSTFPSSVYRLSRATSAAARVPQLPAHSPSLTDAVIRAMRTERRYTSTCNLRATQRERRINFQASLPEATCTASQSRAGKSRRILSPLWLTFAQGYGGRLNARPRRSSPNLPTFRWAGLGRGPPSLIRKYATPVWKIERRLGAALGRPRSIKGWASDRFNQHSPPFLIFSHPSLPPLPLHSYPVPSHSVSYYLLVTIQYCFTTSTSSFFLRAPSIDTKRTLEPSSLSDPRLSGNDGRIVRHRATLTDFALDHHGDHHDSRPRLFHLTTIHVDAAVPLLTSMIAQ
ncbi:uncharacterized protein SCHCODRAFT_02722620 [Schizophyllum commune H4-8]|nr:uncharacterized protein SCHCODRAFT_02722620 [Schizophyllum commune H4-8]KAI5898713.1 hypothetical protein SCHCODRAFT_02722620 [Schizophyllum commune H4-8]